MLTSDDFSLDASQSDLSAFFLLARNTAASPTKLSHSVAALAR